LLFSGELFNFVPTFSYIFFGPLTLDNSGDTLSSLANSSFFFLNTPEFWLDIQRAVDLWYAERENKQEIEKMKFPA